jgi:hypothetical protein
MEAPVFQPFLVPTVFYHSGIVFTGYFHERQGTFEVKTAKMRREYQLRKESRENDPFSCALWSGLPYGFQKACFSDLRIMQFFPTVLKYSIESI